MSLYCATRFESCHHFSIFCIFNCSTYCPTIIKPIKSPLQSTDLLPLEFRSHAIPNWYCMAAISIFYLLIFFFTFMYVYHFTLLTLLLFFIQKLRLKVNSLTFNLSTSRNCIGIAWDLNPFLLLLIYNQNL